MRWTIRIKITIAVLLISLGSIAAVGLYANRISQEALEKRIGQGLSKQSSAIINQLDRILFERYQNIQNWSSLELMLDMLNEDKDGRISQFLTTMKREYSLYMDLVVADNTGTVIASSNPALLNQKVDQELWFQISVSQKEIKVFDYSLSKFTGGYTVPFAAPILTESVINRMTSRTGDAAQRNMLETLSAWKTETLGVFAAFVNGTELMEFINSTQVLEDRDQSPDAYAMLMAQNGYAISQPYFENKAVILHENLIKRGIKAAALAARGKEGYIVEEGRSEHSDFIGYAASKGYKNFKGFGWSVLVFQNADMALAPIKRLQEQLFKIGAGVALIVIIISFFLTSDISQPIEDLAKFARDVGRGDFSKSLEVRSQDEIGALTRSFNEMIRGLRKAQEEITEARDFADNIIKSTVDPLFVMDYEGRIKSFNPAVKNLFGYEPKELQNRNIEKLLSSEQIKDAKMMASLRIGALINADMEFKNKGGDLIPMLVSSAQLKEHSGRSQGVVVIAKDMREYKSLELQFREAQKMDAVGKLTSGIAHDFNNMLTVINGYSEKMLRKLGENDPRGGEIGQVLKAGRRAARLVGQLLAFSRRQIVKPTVIDLNELIIGMDKMLKLIVGKNIEVITLPAKELWPIKVDPGQFEQVIANLSVNARDAMPEGGKLIFDTSNVKITEEYALDHPGMKVGEYVLLSVRDTGMGMTEEIKKRIFEPFFTTKPKGKGTGLGLATCYSVVKQASGYIDVDSAVGVGTTFKLYLPKAEGKAQGMSENEQNIALPTGTETILMVEDEDLVREFTQRQLSELGYKVISASNGVEAMRLAHENASQTIDLLITDVVMPRMGGNQLAEELRKIRPNVRVLFMSGYVDDEMVQEHVLNSTIYFLQKPVTPIALAIKVREVLTTTTQRI